MILNAFSGDASEASTVALVIGISAGPYCVIGCPQANSRFGSTYVTVHVPAIDRSPRTSTALTALPGTSGSGCTAAASAPPGHVEGDTARPDGIPLLAGVAAATRRAIWDRGVFLDAAAGDDVTRRWDSDRFFYLILTGRYDVFIDSRLIRTLGPGDHFGELAARDWGGGYGYARLATVRCAEPGRLIRLASEDLEWLTSTEPTVKARLAATLADRLQNR